MSFEREVLAILARIEAGIANLGPIKAGPYAGQTPGGFGEPIDPAQVDAVLAALGDLGGYGPDAALVERWLREGHSLAQIVAAVNALLISTGFPDRREAAYEIMRGHAAGGWRQVTNRLAGKQDGPIVSQDPANDLLAGISTAHGPADFVDVAQLVIARAEEGVTWRGTRGLEGSDLETAKAALAHAPRAEWMGWIDPLLARVLVLTNVLPLSQPVFQAYPDTTVYADQTLPEYLYGQWVGSRS